MSIITNKLEFIEKLPMARNVDFKTQKIPRPKDF
jgi:hypothetical protein